MKGAEPDLHGLLQVWVNEYSEDARVYLVRFIHVERHPHPNYHADIILDENGFEAAWEVPRLVRPMRLGLFAFAAGWFWSTITRGAPLSELEQLALEDNKKLTLLRPQKKA